MLVTIEEKLSAIKAINESIYKVDLAFERHSKSREINWALVDEDTSDQIFALIQKSYQKQKQELIEKATELMK
jgi:hypothetical protein